MILRPLHSAAPAHGHFLPAWQAVERLQREQYQECWMITQPSHAALASEIAGKLQAPQIPGLDSPLLRAIALHDAGWGIPDAQAIARSRSAKHPAPKSFLDAEVPEFLEAWTRSIQVAQQVGAAGGYIVSRHFQRLAEHRLSVAGDGHRDRKNLESFAAREGQRQKQLAARQKRSVDELESLTDLLQFCDLLSLYLCSGALDNVAFPTFLGVTVRLQIDVEAGYKLEPRLLPTGSRFYAAALKHPDSHDGTAREIEVKIL